MLAAVCAAGVAAAAAVGVRDAEHGTSGVTAALAAPAHRLVRRSKDNHDIEASGMPWQRAIAFCAAVGGVLLFMVTLGLVLQVTDRPRMEARHPGVAHYLIHNYDTPALAARGVPAAERYAGIAADAPHALHMPSHIFTRVGRWEESIDTNRRSAEIARAREEVFDEVHAQDYMVYANLQIGRPAAARAVLDEAKRYASWQAPTPIGYYALAAMPARYALERGAWEEAAALDTRRFGVPYVDAITHFARAVGAARSGRPDAAAADVHDSRRLLGRVVLVVRGVLACVMDLG